MTRPLLIACVCIVVAGAAAITIVVTRGESSVASQMSEEQRATREKFFGTGEALPPIQKGQEMRPKW